MRKINQKKPSKSSQAKKTLAKKVQVKNSTQSKKAKSKKQTSEKNMKSKSINMITQPANKAAIIVKKVVKNNIDASLLKLSPNMQKTLDAIVSKIEKTPAHIQDFQALACRVLKHANEISETLKQKISRTTVSPKSKA